MGGGGERLLKGKVNTCSRRKSYKEANASMSNRDFREGNTILALSASVEGAVHTIALEGRDW